MLALQLALTQPIELPAPAPAPARRLAPLSLPTLRADRVIVDRALFSPSRRDDPSVAGGDPSNPDALPLLGGARAAGVAGVRGALRVVMQSPSGAIRSLRLGQLYEGWRLIAVDSRRVIFQRAGQRVVLAIGEATPGAVSSGAPAISVRSGPTEDEQQ